VIHAWRDVSAVAVLFVWLKLIYYTRGHPATGPFFKMIMKILKDIRFFVVIMTIIVVAFSSAFVVLFEVNETEVSEETKSSFSDFGTAVLTMFRMMLGDFDVSIFQDSTNPVMLQVLFYVYILVVTIVLLNLLIALMSDTYDKVSENLQSLYFMEQANVVFETESSMNIPTAPSSEISIQESTTARKLLASIFDKKNSQRFPKWLHVLQPRSRLHGEDNDDDTWHGKVNAIRQAVDIQSRDLRGTISKLEMATTILQQTTTRRLHAMESKLAAMEGAGVLSEGYVATIVKSVTNSVNASLIKHMDSNKSPLTGPLSADKSDLVGVKEKRKSGIWNRQGSKGK